MVPLGAADGATLNSGPFFGPGLSSIEREAVRFVHRACFVGEGGSNGGSNGSFQSVNRLLAEFGIGPKSLNLGLCFVPQMLKGSPITRLFSWLQWARQSSRSDGRSEEGPGRLPLFPSHLPPAPAEVGDRPPQ